MHSVYELATQDRFRQKIGVRHFFPAFSAASWLASALSTLFGATQEFVQVLEGFSSALRPAFKGAGR